MLAQCDGFAGHHRSGHGKHSNHLAVRRIPIFRRLRHELQQCQVGGLRPIRKPGLGEWRPQALDVRVVRVKSHRGPIARRGSHVLGR